MSDHDAIIKSFTKMETDLETYGNMVLTRLFMEKPETQKLFPKFVGIAPGDLSSNKQVSAHGATVLRKLRELLDNKEHREILRPLSHRHATVHKIPIENFKLISDVLIQVMVEKADLTTGGKSAMKAIMDNYVKEMKGYYDEVAS